MSDVVRDPATCLRGDGGTVLCHSERGQVSDLLVRWNTELRAAVPFAVGVAAAASRRVGREAAECTHKARAVREAGAGAAGID